MGILVYGPMASEVAAQLRAQGLRDGLLLASAPEELPSSLADVEAALVWRAPAEVAARCPHAGLVMSMGAGVEDLLQSPWPESAVLCRVAGVFGPPIAEYVFGELLYVARRIESLRAAQRARLWRPLRPDSLVGQNLGVAGLGSIGRHIARVGRAFRMSVRGMSTGHRPIPTGMQAFGPHQWPEFLADLQVLVLALPLTKATDGLIDLAKLRLLPPEATLVNVGRGGLVVTTDLLQGLAEGQPACAILDVFEEEPLPREHPLWHTPGVVVTPHVAALSDPQQVATQFREALTRYRQGLPPAHRVERDRGY